MHNDPEFDRKFAALRRQERREWEVMHDVMRPLREEQDARWAKARAYLDAQYEPILRDLRSLLAERRWPRA